jgi:hypothetical protein
MNRYWKIRPFNGAMFGPPTNIQRFTVCIPSPPTTPDLIQPTNGSYPLNEENPNFSWSILSRGTNCGGARSSRVINTIDNELYLLIHCC